MIENLSAQKWIKLALIGAVLLVSVLLGAVGLVIEPIYLAAGLGGAIVALGGGLLLLRHSSVGLVLVMAAAIAVPFGLGTGTQTSINAAMLLIMLLVGLWMVKVFIERQPVEFVRSAAIAPLALLVVSAFVSLRIGQLDWFPTQHAPLRAQIGGLMVFVLAALAFWLVAQEMTEVRWLKRMTWVFLVLSGIYLVTVLVPQIGQYTRTIFNSRVFGSVFWIWLVAITFSQTFYNNQLKLPWRIAMGGLLAAGLYVAIVRNITWTSGWAPAVAAVMAMMVLSRSRLSWLVLAAGAAVVLFNIQQVFSMLMAGDNVYSLDTRLAAWGILGEIFNVNFLFGLGPANYYYYTPLFHIMGYYVPFNSHNNYVDIIAQTGIIGLFFFLLFFWKMGWIGLGLLKRVPEGFEKAYVYGALGGIAGTLVSAMLGDWVIPFVYNVGFTGFRASLMGWMFLGGLIVLEKVYQKDS